MLPHQRLLVLQRLPEHRNCLLRRLAFQILRKMTPEQELMVMRSLIRQAYALKEAGVRALHPELTEEEAKEHTRKAVAGDRA